MRFSPENSFHNAFYWFVYVCVYGGAGLWVYVGWPFVQDQSVVAILGWLIGGAGFFWFGYHGMKRLFPDFADDRGWIPGWNGSFFQDERDPAHQRSEDEGVVLDFETERRDSEQDAEFEDEEVVQKRR